MSGVKEETKALSWDFGYQDNVIDLLDVDTLDGVFEQVKSNYNKSILPTNRVTYAIVNHYDKISEDINNFYTSILPGFKTEKGSIACSINGVNHNKMMSINFFPYGTIYMFEK